MNPIQCSAAPCPGRQLRALLLIALSRCSTRRNAPSLAHFHHNLARFQYYCFKRLSAAAGMATEQESLENHQRMAAAQVAKPSQTSLVQTAAGSRTRRRSYLRTCLNVYTHVQLNLPCFHHCCYTGSWNRLQKVLLSHLHFNISAKRNSTRDTYS